MDIVNVLITATPMTGQMIICYQHVRVAAVFRRDANMEIGSPYFMPQSAAPAEFNSRTKTEIAIELSTNGGVKNATLLSSTKAYLYNRKIKASSLCNLDLN